MSVFSVALKAEMEKQSPELFSLVEFDFPSGTSRISTTAISSKTQGHYEDRVQSFGKFNWSVGGRQNSVEAIEVSIRMSDVDMAFLKKLGSGERVQNVAARLKIGSRNVAPASWFSFAGKLYEYQQTGKMQWNMRIHCDDLPMLSQFPRMTIVEADWPNVHYSAVNKIVPYLWGLHDSTTFRKGITPPGAVLTYYVDTGSFYWLVCAGYARVLRVYDGGSMKATGWTYTNAVVHGRPWTYITIAAGAVNATNVTCDVIGYEDVGDGTGKRLLNPVDQLKHCLVNAIYNDPMSANWTGAWLTDAAAPIDTASFAAAKAALANRADGAAYIGAIYLDEQKTGLDVVDEWCANHEIKPVWLPSGKLGLKFDDPSPSASTYISDPWLRYPWDFNAPLKLEVAADDLIDRCEVKSVYQPATGDYLGTLEVWEPLAGDVNRSQSLELTYGPAAE